MVDQSLQQESVSTSIDGVRAGVFICRCGVKMDEAVDTADLCRQVAGLPNVAHAEVDAYPCSRGGQAHLKQVVEEKALDRVLVAGCAPRLVGRLFREAGQAAGLKPEHMEVANIREACASLTSGDPQEGLNFALRSISIELARLGRMGEFQDESYPVSPGVLVVGGGLAGLAVATQLADHGQEVVLVEASGELGGKTFSGDGTSREAGLAAAVRRDVRITALTSARLTRIDGRPGEYQVQVSQGDRVTTHTVGALIMSAEAQPRPWQPSRWFDRTRVRTQVEFAVELESGVGRDNGSAPKEIVMILGMGETDCEPCSRICCRTALRQAVRAREVYPASKVTILFRELCLGEKGGDGENELLQAKSKGVAFVRFHKNKPPVIGEKTITITDSLEFKGEKPKIGAMLELPYDRAVISTPLVSDPSTGQFSSLLHLPQDSQGFLIDRRLRLRPGRFVDDGIYLVGGAHQPVDESETLLQAYLVAERALRFIERESITVNHPVAQVNPERCTGCGDCAQVCPEHAIQMVRRIGILSLSQVEPARCTACGACVVACPVKAITLAGQEDGTILAQIDTALQPTGSQPDGAPRILVLGCEWSGYAAYEVAGGRRVGYPGNFSVVRLNCSARFDPLHVLWALVNGAEGVLMLACPPGDCHYGNGNRLAGERMEALINQIGRHGIDPRRVRLVYLKGDDAEKFRRTVADFVTALEDGREVVASGNRRTLW